MTDTIYALATAAGQAAVAVIRVSGAEAGPALRALSKSTLPAPRYAAVRRLYGEDGELIDRALVLWMPGPSSFTGEDCLELQVHGGPAVLDGLAVALQAHGLRPAQPGEFSRRAFANGKLDLLQAEAISDLVEAQTAAQRRQALAQMAGDIGQRYSEWRGRLIEALAFIEAENDFPDEDLPGDLAERARPAMEAVRNDLAAALGTASRGRAVREGFRVALIGAPNAGKSSLFNALVGRDAAIVSAQAGTTRDVVEAELVLSGYRVTLADTAGVRDATEEIEAEGVRRARAWAEGADLRLLVIEPDTELKDVFWSLVQPDDFVVLSKADLALDKDARARDEAELRGAKVVESSVRGPIGVADLRVQLERRVTGELASAEPPFATRLRHQEALSDALTALERGLNVLASGPERAAEDVRQAAAALQSIVGDVDREAVLDRVFASFCIGK